MKTATFIIVKNETNNKEHSCSISQKAEPLKHENTGRLKSFAYLNGKEKSSNCGVLLVRNGAINMNNVTVSKTERTLFSCALAR